MSRSEGRWPIVWVLLVVALLRFVNLGFSDLQPWDESLYALRAETVTKFGDWVDQSPHAVGGLYSSLHPPLYVWLTSVVYLVDGASEFSARIVSALAGALLVIVSFFMARDLYGRRAGIAAALLVGLQPLPFFWSRQGQFDMLLLLLMAASCYVFILFLRSRKSSLAVAAGLLLGLGLMTKLFVALLIPMCWLAIFPLAAPPERRTIVRGAAVALFVAAAIALPWHLVMAERHGANVLTFFLSNASITERTFVGIEGNVKPLGWFFFINQLAIGVPVAFVFGFHRVVKAVGGDSGTPARPGRLPELVLVAWLVAFFLVFTVMKTKLAVYALPISFPLCILASRTLSDISGGTLRRGAYRLLLISAAVVILWALLPELRGSLRTLGRSTAPGSDWPKVIAVAGVCAIVVVGFFHWDGIGRWVILWAVGIGLGLSALFSAAVGSRFWYRQGGRDVAQFLDSSGARKIAVIGSGVNPQLSFYLKGADLGWRDSVQFERLDPSQDVGKIAGRINTKLRWGWWIVLEKDEIWKGLYRGENEVIPPGFVRVYSTTMYAVYSEE